MRKLKRRIKRHKRNYSNLILLKENGVDSTLASVVDGRSYMDVIVSLPRALKHHVSSYTRERDLSNQYDNERR